MKKRRLSPFRGDRSLWIIISILLVISLLVIYSSTVSLAHAEKSVSGDTSYFMLRQAKFIIFSFLVMIFIHWIDFKYYARFIRLIFYFSVGLVILAMFIGESRNEATRWIPIPFFGRFQPSEMLKIALIALLAVQLGARSTIISKIPIIPSLSYKGWITSPHKNHDIWNKTTKPLVLPAAIACAVILPMNLSTAMIMFLVTLIIFIVGRVRMGEIWRIIKIGIVTLTVIITVMMLFGVGRAETWLSRIENYVAPLVGVQKTETKKDVAENFQKEQAKIAIASGGLIGKGPGNSTQRSQLPHPYSDYAYAFIIEEYGAFGGAVIFLLYLWIFYRTGVVMRRCRNTTTALLVFGLGLSITVQAFVNMLVCVGLFPVTGQPLPLISMGGSSVMFTCIAFGIILSISRQNNQEDAAEALAAKQATEQPQIQTTTEAETEKSTEEQEYQYEDDYQEIDNEPEPEQPVTKHQQYSYYAQEKEEQKDNEPEEPINNNRAMFVEPYSVSKKQDYDDNTQPIQSPRRGRSLFVEPSEPKYRDEHEEEREPVKAPPIAKKRKTVEPEEDEDDFPFTVVEKGDSRTIRDSKVDRNSVDLY